MPLRNRPALSRYAKEKNVPAPIRGQFGVGDVYTWTAIDAESKLAISFLVGLRTPEFAGPFIQDVADRLAHRVQLTTDGHHAYLYAVYNAFHGQIDYSMLQKIYGKPPQGQKTTEGKYSPPQCIGQKKFRIWGKPDDSRVSTSYVERQNLTMRMSMRRFTRLTNGFSKKVENLAASVALWFLYYNFARVHMTLKTTPAVAAGIADHVWTLDEIITLLDSSDSN